MDIILYFLQCMQYQHKQICWLLNFICRYIPLKKWAFDDSHSPKYQKFKVDELPLITDFRQDWTYKELIPYYEKRYGKKIRPISRRSECDIPDSCTCPRCDAPKPFLYKNNGSKGQLLCKICDARFSPDESRFSAVKLRCPHCGNTLVPKKDRKHFIVHKCVNPKCSYYLHNLKKVDKADLKEDYGKNKYKLHYIYREFTMDFFSMDLNTLPKNASSLKFSRHNAHAVVTYANMRGIRSVDRIVDLCERDLAFIWLTRGQKPRRDAFYDFKSRKLTSDILDDLNYQFMRRLQKEGLVTLKELFIDGTKIEANANRYIFVWRGSINYHLAGLLDSIDQLFEKYNAFLQENDYGSKYELGNAQMFVIEGMDKVREVIEKNRKRKLVKHKKFSNTCVPNLKRKKLGFYHLTKVITMVQVTHLIRVELKQTTFGKKSLPRVSFQIF